MGSASRRRVGVEDDAGIEELPCEGKAMFNPAALNPVAQAWRKVRRVVSCVTFIFIEQPLVYSGLKSALGGLSRFHSAEQLYCFAEPKST